MATSTTAAKYPVFLCSKILVEAQQGKIANLLPKRHTKSAKLSVCCFGFLFVRDE
jgi:hypothetical protein